MHDDTIIMLMRCNAWSFLRSSLQNPSQEFHKNLFDFEKPQILQKSKKLRLQSIKCMRMRDLKLTKWRKTWISLKNPWGRGWRWVREVWKVKRLDRLREIKRNEIRNHECPLYSPSVNLNRLRGVEDLSSSVQGKKEAQWIEDQSSSYQGDRNFLNRSP